MLTRRHVGGLIGTAAVTAAGLAILRGGGHSGDDIRSFGAVGDGRADDAPAIQRAIDTGQPVLHFPAGAYLLGAPLRPRSGQTWTGDGSERSVLTYSGAPTKRPFNLVHLRGTIEDFAVENIGFRGGRTAQKERSPDGQSAFAIYMRGALRGITLRGCRFEGFGDGAKSGGGVVFGPAPYEQDQALADIVVKDCLFRGNGNVPGLYVSGGAIGATARSGVTISGNRFEGIAGSTKVQNAVYVLGEPGTPISLVDISHNMFDFVSPVDAAIELNWTQNFTITGNIIQFRAAIAHSTAVLLRDGVRAGTVSTNVIASTSPEKELRGIVLVNFSDGTIEDVTIASNTLTGVPHAILVDRGSRGVQVSSNRIAGSADLGVAGIRIVDAEEVIAHGNLISGMRRAIEIGAGSSPVSRVRAVEILNNVFSRCGGSEQPLVALAGGAETLFDLVLRANRAIAPLPGTPAFADAALAPVTTMADNVLGGLPAMR